MKRKDYIKLKNYRKLENNMPQDPEKNSSIITLESEIKTFADTLPFWLKYLLEKIFQGNEISQEDIDQAYKYLLEDIKDTPKNNRKKIIFSDLKYNGRSYYENIQLSSLKNVEGVNALQEGYNIEFSSGLTLIYGENGSGKSGYTRLLKKAFYSRAKDDILSNIYSAEPPKPIKADFTFVNETEEISFPFSKINLPIFDQFSVFDGKSIVKHLEYKNEFDFKPAGLKYFEKIADTVYLVEKKALDEKKIIENSGYNLEDLLTIFDGESEIKEAVKNLSTKKETFEHLKDYKNFSSDEKKGIEKEYDELFIASANKNKEIKKLKHLKQQIEIKKEEINSLNTAFSRRALDRVNSLITDYTQKEQKAKADGIQKFDTDKIKGIGTTEWRSFIIAAQQLADIQNKAKKDYPTQDDKCLFCMQDLNRLSKELIENYWSFIKSEAEANLSEANTSIAKAEAFYKKLTFTLFPSNDTLTLWLQENKTELLKKILHELEKQKKLNLTFLNGIKNKEKIVYEEVNINTDWLDNIKQDIDIILVNLETDKEIDQLQQLYDLKKKFEHQEKLKNHFDKLESYFNKQIDLENHNKIQFPKKKITLKEKSLSKKYFNTKYVEKFNQECKNLGADFDIEIQHTGSAAKSYRQLKIKGNSPSVIFSEGEQRVIAIADFFAEMSLSEINKGVIFDDPVTSLDNKRKLEIANRLAEESHKKQVIVFTHDLSFAYNVLSKCKELEGEYSCHWIENIDGMTPGAIYLNNSPSFEKDYKTSGKAQGWLDKAKKSSPESREEALKNGFAALRTSYESQIVFGLFRGVVQRFNERVSVESLKDVYVTQEIKEEILTSFASCCKFMEGHSHSDSNGYKKPTINDLQNEISQFNAVKKKIAKCKI